MKALILGCGTSTGVPRVGNDWGKCDPNEPRNRRSRVSIMVENQAGKRLLVDTSTDLRMQLLANDIDRIDAVFWTHEHADHTHGIDDLRAFFLMKRRRVPVWADEPTGHMLTTRFAYCFYTAPGSDYPPILNLHRLSAGTHVTIGGAGGDIVGLPFRVHHGNIDALGFRIGNAAYTPDLNGVPDVSLHALENLDLWVVDALRRTKHPSHWSLPETLHWIDRMKPKRAIITNMHIDLDFDMLRRELPAHVEPAFDGLELTL